MSCIEPVRMGGGTNEAEAETEAKAEAEAAAETAAAVEAEAAVEAAAEADTGAELLAAAVAFDRGAGVRKEKSEAR